MRLLTIQETGQILHLSRWTVVSMIETGALPAILLRCGKKKKVWRVREEVLEKWLRTREEETRRMIQRRPAALSIVNGEQAE